MKESKDWESNITSISPKIITALFFDGFLT